MDASYTVESDRGLVWVELAGWITPEGMLTVLSEVAGDPDLRPGLGLLINSQTVDSATTEVVRAVVRPLRRIRERIGAYRIAVVVTSVASFGMTNLGRFHLEPEKIELRGFRSVAEAEAWLLRGPGHGTGERPDEADPGAPSR